MEELEGCVLFASPKQQETQRLRERNRTAKRASRARQRQHDPTALPWPSSLDEDWPGFSGSLVDTLSPRQLSVSVPGRCNPEPRAPPASSSSLTSNSNDFNSKPLRLLHIAAHNGTTGILLSLIKAGADVNSRDCSGTTPLHIAVRFRRASALELLVSHGANMNARDSANMTALEGAVRAQDEEHVNIPLSGGAELH
ncbi:Ankyrin repeat [Fusarium oxysporum f. sp. vasinfectum]|nr:Ankyrin repeat [Fusarium oxysporum f. sp. vasinfectum]